MRSAIDSTLTLEKLISMPESQLFDRKVLAWRKKS